ncbi:MAG: hypothetical protein ABEJ83_03025 [Candidatus Nanohaloarchaea archaeon]
MNKLIGLAVLVLVAGIGLLAFTGASSIDFKDLETECRYNKNPQGEFRLAEDNSLHFKGNFPVNTISSDLSFSYSKGSTITLNIKAEETEKPDSFYNNCVASVVYDAETQPLKPGRYKVQLKHDGKQVEEQIIDVEA